MPQECRVWSATRCGLGSDLSGCVLACAPNESPGEIGEWPSRSLGAAAAGDRVRHYRHRTSPKVRLSGSTAPSSPTLRAVFGGTPDRTGPTLGPITVVATATIARTRDLEVAFILAGVFQILVHWFIIRHAPPVISGFMGNRDPHHHDPADSSSSLLVLVTVVLLLASGRFIKAIPISALRPGGQLPVPPARAPWLRDLRAGPVSITRTVDHIIGEIPRPCRLRLPASRQLTMLQVLLSAGRAVGILDSPLTSRSADNIRGTRHRNNKEPIGQGRRRASFGGLSGAGATVRSVVNVRNGGQTALVGATHSCRFLCSFSLPALVPVCTSRLPCCREQWILPPLSAPA